jgi:hypothetical protein
VKEIHEKIHADPEMQVLTLKLRELIETAEEQERKVLKASLSVSSDSSLLVSAGTAAVAKDKARADVEEPLIPGLMSPESSSPVDRSIMSDDEMSTSPSSGVKMSRIAERPAPPIPSDDEEGF